MLKKSLRLNIFNNLFLALIIIILFYSIINIFIIKPLIHQETGFCLVGAYVDHGYGINNGDPWWGAEKGSFYWIPPIRTFLLYNINQVINNPNIMAAIMSTIYAVLAVITWWVFSKKLEMSDNKFNGIFALFATLPFSYDLWTVGLSQGFKDITFIVIFTPLILWKLIETLKTNKIIDILLLGLICSFYFLMHPTQAILVLQIPFFVLLICSEKKHLIKNVLLYSLSLIPICGTYLYILSSRTLSTSVPYNEFILLINYRFNFIFPYNSYMANIPFIGKYFGIVANNFIYAISGLFFIFLFIYAIKKKDITKNLLLVIFIFNILSIYFLGFYRLAIISTLGWFLFYNKKEFNDKLKWLVFLPLLLMPNTYTVQAICRIVGDLLQKHILDHQYLLNLLTIPYLIIGTWLLIREITQNIQNYFLKASIVISLCILYFLWYWKAISFNIFILLNSSVIFYFYFLTDEIKALLKTKIKNIINKNALLKLIKNRLIFFKNYIFIFNLKAKGLRLSLFFLITFLIMLILYKKDIIKIPIPYIWQKHIAESTLGLAENINKFVPQDGRFLTAPYSMRLLTKRFIYITKKDFNLYYSTRDIEKMRKWEEVSIVLKKLLKTEDTSGDNEFDFKDSIGLFQLMNEKNCEYVVSISDLDDKLFDLLGKTKQHRLYKIKQL